MWIGQQIEPRDYQKYFGNIIKCTLSTKLRDFQYRLCVGYTVTNVDLTHWGIKNSKLCTFCNIARETVIHLLHECNIVKEVLNQLKNFIQTNVMTDINWSIKTFIFNCVHIRPNPVVNLITLIAKQYTYRARCAQIIPNFNLIKSEIHKVHSIELHIAKTKGTVLKHMLKWQALIDYDMDSSVENSIL